MKRDMDLVRALLLKVEADGSPALRHVPEMPGFDSPAVVEHVRLCLDAGLVTAIDATTLKSRNYIQIELTWSGHEFLNSVRDPAIWTQTKAGAAKVGSFSMPLIMELAAGFLKAKAASLGLPMM